MGFQYPADLSDQPSIYQSGKNRSEFDSLEMTEAKEQEGKKNGEDTAADIINDLDRVNVFMKTGRNLLHDQLIGFRRNIGMEHERNTGGTEQKPNQEEKETDHKPFSGDQTNQVQHQVQ